ncbi:hypothetical protein FQA47_007454 [Oryzias melastigma]|uniref:Uncharacterized protein n=1 Tax=Oryzias melastigma TaxID=30732 RepID=A0A834BQZ7_ORYME|nr:hypothetical protein FQA47_007454 [Oryzias melastigma]
MRFANLRVVLDPRKLPKNGKKESPVGRRKPLQCPRTARRWGGTSLSTGRAAQEAGSQTAVTPVPSPRITRKCHGCCKYPEKLTVMCLDRPPALSSVSVLLNEAAAS